MRSSQNVRQGFQSIHRLKLALVAVLLIESVACAGLPVPPTLTPAATLPPTVTLPPTATPLPSLTPVPTPVPGVLYVDAAQDLGPISPLVYGTNYGPWLGISLGIKPLAVDAHLTFMRFPGGNWGDQNDVTPLQIDTLMSLCKDLGCEPMINVRLLNSTPQKAADLVNYSNLARHYHIRYWGIGNEPNLYVDQTAVEHFNENWRIWAEAMRAVDPTIKLIGPEMSQFYANPSGAYEQNIINRLTDFLKVNGDLVDIISIHRYAFPASTTAGPPSIEDLRNNSREWDQLIPALRAIIRETTGRDLPVAVTEVNSSWAPNTGGEATMDSHYNAIWWGDVLGRLIRQKVELVAQFAIRGEFGIFGQFDAHPMYGVYLMYQHFGQEFVYASSDDPDISIYADKRDDGALTLMLVNLSREARDKELTLANFTPGPSAETWLFDPTHLAESVDPTSVGTSTTLSLPAQSLTLLIVPAQ
jgi:hypothetical protein